MKISYIPCITKATTTNLPKIAKVTCEGIGAYRTEVFINLMGSCLNWIFIAIYCLECIRTLHRSEKNNEPFPLKRLGVLTVQYVGCYFFVSIVKVVLTYFLFL